MAIAFVRIIPRPDDAMDAETEFLGHIVRFTVEEDETANTWCDKLGISQFVLSSFQLITWAFFFGASVQFMYLINIGTYIHSYKMPGFGSYMTIVSPICGAVFTFASGVVSDRTITCTSRITYVLFGTGIQTLFFFLSINWGDNYYIFIITSLVVYSNNGIYWSIVPALVSEYFGIKHFTRNWGLLIMCNAFLSLGTCGAFAAFYDAKSIKNSSGCLGLPCFSDSYMIGAFASLISTVLFALLRVVENKQRKTSPPGTKTKYSTVIGELGQARTE